MCVFFTFQTRCYFILTATDSPYADDEGEFARAELTDDMQHWVLAVMGAGPRDAPEVVRTATVMGFVYVTHVDAEKRKLKVLAPVSGRMGDRPLVWGRWPEPCMNLLG